MKKFTVYANCQSAALSRTLLENEEFASTHKLVPIPPVQNLNISHVPDIISIIKNVDVLIYQPIGITGNRPKELSSSFLTSKAKSDSTLISFPSIYFDGYFPHLQTFTGYVASLNLVHDYFIAYLCSIGFSETKTYNLLQSETLYPKDLSVVLAERSIENLRNRENELNIDVKISNYIDQNYKSTKLFNQFNHPKRSVFKFLSESILQRIGISSFHIEENGPSHLDSIMTPIYRSTYNNLGLCFGEDFEAYRAGNDGDKNQQSIIREFFNFYRKKDLNVIKKHVCKTKPFIPRIIDDIKSL